MSKTALSEDTVTDEQRGAPVGPGQVTATEARSLQTAPTGRRKAVALATTYSPAELLHTAILQGADVEVIERLSALAERWQIAQDARKAKAAFFTAFADAKTVMPTIRKNRRVKFKGSAGKADTDYRHEDLAEVVKTVQAVFSEHGLFFRWRTAQPQPGVVTIACILSHRDGHSEETELTAGVDTSGNKNHIQAIKSVSTYLERATLLAAAGVAAHGEDDDGRSAGEPAGGFPADREPVITSDQITQLRNKCKAVGCPEKKFLQWADVARMEDILAAAFDGCMAGLASFQRAS